LLGPSAAVVVLTTVLIVQCFLFGDGGVVALGANIFNMAIVGGAGGYVIYRLARCCVGGLRGQVTAVAFAGWCSTVLSAICCAGQLAWSGRVSWTAAFSAMAGIHILIGIGEAAIGALAYLAVVRTRPDVVQESAVSGDRSPANLVWYGALMALGMALFLAPWVCPWPDGLESVASKLGFEHMGVSGVHAPVPDYQMPGVGWAAGATALAGGVGTVVAFGLAWLLGRMLVPAQPKAAN
jgi:cobalt/nickel transport system permease protein